MRRTIIVAAALLFFAGSVTEAYSQSLLRNVVRKVNKKVEREIEKKVYEAVVDAVTDTLVAITDSIVTAADSARMVSDSVMLAYEAERQALETDGQPAAANRQAHDTRRQQVIAQFAGRAPSQEKPFFLSESGVVITHVGKNAKGKVESYSKNTIIAVDYIDERNFSVESSMEVFDDNMNPLMPEPLLSEVTVENGIVTLNPGGMAGQMTDGMEISGDLFFIPDNIVVGDELMDYEVTVSIGGIKTTSNGTGIKVTGRETVEISGYAIDCYIIESTVVAKAFGMKTEVVQKVWYGRGVGEVKTETYDSKGRLQSVSEVVEITGMQ